jgi:hypothetical protein
MWYGGVPPWSINFSSSSPSAARIGSCLSRSWIRTGYLGGAQLMRTGTHPRLLRHTMWFAWIVAISLTTTGAACESSRSRFLPHPCLARFSAFSASPEFTLTLKWRSGEASASTLPSAILLANLSTGLLIPASCFSSSRRFKRHQSSSDRVGRPLN